MNVAFGDIFNQGRLSVYVTNISEAGVLIQGNNLWVPREGATRAIRLQYENLAGSLGVELGGWSFGAQFGDLNNDGTQDLFLTNGYVSAAKGTSYWYEFSMVAGGNSSIISDAANWPPMEGKVSRVTSRRGFGSTTARVISRRSRRRSATPTPTTDVASPWSTCGTAACSTSWWPTSADRSWSTRTRCRRRMPGSISSCRKPLATAGAIGAQVRLFWNGQEQLQEVSGGCGYAAQNQRRLHFGLGKAPRIEKAVIRWPSGTVQTIESPAAGHVHQIEEPR